MRISLPLIAAAICLCWLGGQNRLAAEEAKSATSPSQAKLAAKLAAPAELDFQDTPLSELPNWLRAYHDVQAVLDIKAMEDAGVPADTPVTISIKGITLGAALRHALRTQDLTWAVADEVLVITTPEEAEQSHLETRVYAIADLIAPSDRRPNASDNAEALQEIIVNSVDPDRWDEVGGPGSLSFREGMLAVCQTREVQEHVASLLAALKQAHAENPPAVILPPGVSENAQRRLDAIYEALARPIDLELTKVPLVDFAAKVAEERHVPVLIEAKALEDAGVAVDTPLTASLRDSALGTALALILRQQDLTWTVRDEALVITTPEEADQSGLQVRVFPLPGLVRTDSEAAEEASSEELIDMVQHVLATDAWDEVGGTGSLEREPSSRTLVCTQTVQVQQQLASFLSALRRARDAQAESVEWFEEQGERFEVRVHELHFKPDDPAQGDEANVSRMIQELIEPESWHRDKAYIRLLGNRLVVRQSVRIHREIEKLLRTLWPMPESGLHNGPGFGMGGM